MDVVTYDLQKLNGALEGTVIRKYLMQFSKQISSRIKSSSENNFILENIETLALSKKSYERIQGLYEDLLNLYNSKFSPNYSYVVPENIKIVQASLLDGLMFGYNMNTGAIALYTTNVKSLFNMGINTPKLLESCYSNNLNGMLFAYRIDIEYASHGQVLYKAVKPIGNKKLVMSDFCFFPYDYVYAAMGLLNSWLNKGMTFKIVQTMDGLIKERFVSCSEKVLSEYCDSEEAVKGLKATMFPVKGIAYLPVLGAPSITSMVTKVDFFSVDTIYPVSSKADIKVERVKNPIESVMLKSAIMNKLREANSEGNWEYFDMLENVPSFAKYFKSESDLYTADVRNLSKILDSLTVEELKQVCSDVGGEENYKNMLSLVKKPEVMDISGMSDDEIRNMLSNGIYNVTYMGKGCKNLSMTVTNSGFYLKKMYGSDYFGRCEGFNPRWYKLRSLLTKSNDSADTILEYCGFPVNDDTVKFCNDIRNGTLSEEMKQSFLDSSNIVEEHSPSDTKSILCRVCFGAVSMQDGKVQGYYRYFDRDRVIRVVKLS